MWVWCLIPFSCFSYSLCFSEVGKTLSRTRKTFLEAGSGFCGTKFCGNAFKSWGEAQLHELWMAVEVLGRAALFGAEWAEPIPWTESVVWMLWTNTTLGEEKRWRQWSGVIVTVPEAGRAVWPNPNTALPPVSVRTGRVSHLQLHWLILYFLLYCDYLKVLKAMLVFHSFCWQVPGITVEFSALTH